MKKGSNGGLLIRGGREYKEATSKGNIREERGDGKGGRESPKSE